jgi:hypothetical protein
MKFKSAALILILFATYAATRSKEMPRRPFYLQTPITVDGAEIPPGMYEFVVEFDRSNVRVSIWHLGRFFAAARGTWVKSAIKYSEDALLLHVNSDGTRSLIEIRLAGDSKTILLGGSSQFVRLAPK